MLLRPPSRRHRPGVLMDPLSHMLSLSVPRATRIVTPPIFQLACAVLTPAPLAARRASVRGLYLGRTAIGSAVSMRRTGWSSDGIVSRRRDSTKPRTRSGQFTGEADSEAGRARGPRHILELAGGVDQRLRRDAAAGQAGVPPSRRNSTSTVSMPNCPLRMAATYPPGRPPITGALVLSVCIRLDSQTEAPAPRSAVSAAARSGRRLGESSKIALKPPGSKHSQPIA